jgi:hypothetical protein
MDLTNKNFFMKTSYLFLKHAYKDKVNKDNINPRFGRDHNALKT